VAELLGPAQIRARAAEVGLRPTKSRGQNFVIDANTVRRIVARANLVPNDVVLEVGPGLGSLTLGLLPSVRHVTAVEVDETLAAALPDTVSRHAPELQSRLTVVTADALDLPELPQPMPTALVANLPYNVAVPVLLEALAHYDTITHGLVMVQKEVADRLCAPPGSRVYGAPSVKLAWYAQAAPAGDVSARVFWPEPRVASGLVAFHRHREPYPAQLREQTFAAIDQAFNQRRKTLRAALAGWAGSADRAAELLTVAGLEPTARGETLSARDFYRLAQVATTAGKPGLASENRPPHHP